MTGRDSGRYDVTDYGATDSDESNDTEAIQAALDDCAESGGTVYVPPGEYLSAPLTVGDRTTFRLDAGATLAFVEDFRAFPEAESRWEGWDQVGFHPCLRVADAQDVAVTGRGTIDGGGPYWWDIYDRPESAYPGALRDRLADFAERNGKSDDVSDFTLRPPLFQVYDSENVSVSGVTLRNSPFWNTHVVYSENVSFDDVTIENPAGAPNGDGIDIDSSRLVRISDTYINAGDDAVCIKSGKDAEGRAVGEPAEQIAVSNCTIEHGHGGVVVGSEMSGDVRDVVVTNCTFTDTDRGIRIKTQRGRGGTVEDLRFDNIVMRRVVCPFVINGYYFTSIDSDPEPVDETTPTIRNVHFHQITARDVASAGFVAGLPERPLQRIVFSDVEVDATRAHDAEDIEPAMADDYEPTDGFFCKSVGDVTLRNVQIRTSEGPAGTFVDTESLSVENLTVASEADPALETRDVEAVELRACSTPEEARTTLRATGEATESITLAGHRPGVDDAVELGDELSADVVERI